MKTRRKRTPNKSRRSSIIGIKKSPVARKNTRANKSSNNKFAKLALAVYESPLDRNNCYRG